MTIDEVGFVPLSTTGAELLFEVFSQRYERGSVMVPTNLPFNELTEGFGSERLTGALLDRLTHHVHILEMNGESYRLKCSRENAAAPAPDESRRPRSRARSRPHSSTRPAFCQSCSLYTSPQLALTFTLPLVTSSGVHFCSAPLVDGLRLCQ